MALKHVTSVPVYVNNQDKAVDFYTTKLGFEKRTDAPMGEEDPSVRWIEMALPDAQTSIVLVRGYADWSADKVGKFTGMVIGTDDITGTYEELKGRGVNFTQVPEKAPWGGSYGQFQDQDGNEFGLVGE